MTDGRSPGRPAIGGDAAAAGAAGDATTNAELVDAAGRDLTGEPTTHPGGCAPGAEPAAGVG